MEIIIGEKSGFCAGVSFTIKKAQELLDNNDKVYCLGEIVHNEIVVDSLEKKGMITVDNIDEIPNGSKVIFRAHGEAKKIYELANNKNLEIFDLTCGKVKLIHNKIEKNNNCFIIIVGKKTHPETIGHYGYADNGIVVENLNDIELCLEEYNKTDKKEIYVVAQTTFNDNKFEEIVTKIKELFANKSVIVDKTICSATRERQEEVVSLAKKVEVMIIVGGKNSSNTKELYNLALDNCENVYLVQDENDLKNVDFKKIKSVGIMAGASTPNDVIDDIINFIK